MVGPDVSKEKLQSMLSNINRIGGTSARVITYSAVGN
jgi:DedD protein